jgi:hypothetical protein
VRATGQVLLCAAAIATADGGTASARGARRRAQVGVVVDFEPDAHQARRRAPRCRPGARADHADLQLELAPDPDPAPGADDIALHATADRCASGARFPSTTAVDSAGNPYPKVADELKECSNGIWSGTVTIPNDGSVVNGTYRVIVSSQVDHLPLQSNGATTAVVAGGTISGTMLSEFSVSNLTTPITGASDPITVTVSAARCNGKSTRGGAGR